MEGRREVYFGRVTLYVLRIESMMNEELDDRPTQQLRSTHRFKTASNHPPREPSKCYVVLNLFSKN